MGAKTRTLMSLEEVTDHDCGNYQIGEIDWRIHTGILEQYLERYGIDGRNELVTSLGYLIAHVFRAWEDMQKPPESAGPRG